VDDHVPVQDRDEPLREHRLDGSGRADETGVGPPDEREWTHRQRRHTRPLKGGDDPVQESTHRTVNVEKRRAVVCARTRGDPMLGSRGVAETAATVDHNRWASVNCRSRVVRRGIERVTDNRRGGSERLRVDGLVVVFVCEDAPAEFEDSRHLSPRRRPPVSSSAWKASSQAGA